MNGDSVVVDCGSAGGGCGGVVVVMVVVVVVVVVWVECRCATLT